MSEVIQVFQFKDLLTSRLSKILSLIQMPSEKQLHHSNRGFKVFIHPRFDTHVMDALTIHSSGEEELETQTTHFRDLELQINSNLDLPDSQCSSDITYSYSKEFKLQFTSMVLS